MLDNKLIHVAVRSYKRAGQVTTLKHAPYASVWVPESQGDAYRQHYGDRVVTIPDSEDGSPARKNNAILDRSPAPWTLILDDDITGIARYEGGVKSDLTPAEFAWLITHTFNLAAELGVRLWGINQNSDPMAYRAFAPYSFLAPILGPIQGHLNPILRFDETTGAKEDYDFWLQNIAVYRRTLRWNKYHYRHNHATKAGGITSFRTVELERKWALRMVEKWGKDVFQRAGGSSGGASATGRNILNSNVHVPIPGI